MGVGIQLWQPWGFSLLVELQNSTHRARPVGIVIRTAKIPYKSSYETVLCCFLLYTQTPSTPVVARGSSSMSPGLPVGGEFLSPWSCPIHHFRILPAGGSIPDMPSLPVVSYRGQEISFLPIRGQNLMIKS